MRNMHRMDEFLAKFQEYWEKVPDWRFMQLICNLQSASGSDMFYVEDDKFFEYLDAYFEGVEP